MSAKIGGRIGAGKFSFNSKTATIGFVVGTGTAMGIFLMILLSHLK
jgi:hypothetical protein